MTNVGCEVGVVSHRFASIHSLLTTQTDSFTNKNLRKNHLRNKKEDLRKTPLNYWYSIQNRSKQNRITKSQQTFFDFFLKTGVTFPFFSSLIYETRLVAVAERHTRSDCGLYLLDTIYICIKFIGAPIVVPRFAFLPSNLPVSIRFLNQEFASKESKSVCGYQSFRMRWLMCRWKSVGIWGGKNQSETALKWCVTYWYTMVKRKGNKHKSLYRKCL